MTIGRPKQDKTMTRKTIRFFNDDWAAGIEKAKAQGFTISEVIRALLKAWIDGKIVIDVKNVD